MMRAMGSSPASLVCVANSPFVRRLPMMGFAFCNIKG